MSSEDIDGDESAQSLGISPASLASSSGSGGGGSGGGVGCFISSTVNYYSWNENFNTDLPIRIINIGLILFLGVGLLFRSALSRKFKISD